MAQRADEEIPQFVTFQSWRVRVAIAVVFFVVMMAAFALVPGGPWHLTTAPVYVVGFMTYSFVVNRAVALRLEDQAVDIRQGWRKARIPYEQITGVAVGPETAWWLIGRRVAGGGATGYLVGGPSVRLTTGEKSVVISVEEAYRVAGEIQRRCVHATGGRAAGTEQTGR